MAKSEPSWELYRTFLDVLHDGSLSGAARRLGLTQPTTGRHIDALERALGVKLFTRSQRGLQATAAARELIPHVEAMAAAHAALVRAASGETGQERGTVRLTASEIVGGEVLPEILAQFCDRHRGIVPELVLDNRTLDLVRRDADVAVRMARPTQGSLIARRIGTVRIGLFAHRRYVERHGLPATIDEIAQHRLVGYDRDDHSYRSVGEKPRYLSREQFGFRCDSDIAQLAAIRAGIGIGGAQLPLAARSRDLIPVLPRLVAFKLEMWVAMHESLKSTRRVRLLFDHLCDRLGAYVRSGVA